MENGQVQSYHGPSNRDPVQLCARACPPTAASQDEPCLLLSSTWPAHLPRPGVCPGPRWVTSLPTWHPLQQPSSLTRWPAPPSSSALRDHGKRHLYLRCQLHFREAQAGDGARRSNTGGAGLRPWVPAPAPRKTNTKTKTNHKSFQGKCISVLEKPRLVARFYYLRSLEGVGEGEDRTREISKVCLKYLMRRCLK